MAPLKVAFKTEPRNPLLTDLPEVNLSTKQRIKALELVKQTKIVQDWTRNNILSAQTL
jgi:hypothetical protein